MQKQTLTSGTKTRPLGSLSAAVAMTAVAGLLTVASPAQAVLVYSGPVNIEIPDTIDGIYMNVVTGDTGSSGFTGYDINPYSADNGLSGDFFSLWGPTANTWLSPSGVIGGPYPLAVSTMIDGTGTYLRPGGGTNVGAQVTLNAPNYLGFRFVNESAGNATHFGWLEVTFGATAGERAITGYAYDDSGAGVMAGVVPEPGTVALWLAGLATLGGVAIRRRKTDPAAQ